MQAAVNLLRTMWRGRGGKRGGANGLMRSQCLAINKRTRQVDLENIESPTVGTAIEPMRSKPCLAPCLPDLRFTLVADVGSTAPRRRAYRRGYGGVFVLYTNPLSFNSSPATAYAQSSCCSSEKPSAENCYSCLPGRPIPVTPRIFSSERRLIITPTTQRIPPKSTCGIPRAVSRLDSKIFVTSSSS